MALVCIIRLEVNFLCLVLSEWFIRLLKITRIKFINSLYAKMGLRPRVDRQPKANIPKNTNKVSST